MATLLKEYKLISDTLFSMNVIDAETKETAKSYSDRLAEIRQSLNLSHDEIQYELAKREMAGIMITSAVLFNL